jgi:D-serine deaminase-like pyridoxal phosphate-dependent protein
LTGTRLRREDIPTPALLLDLPALERNIAAMASWARAERISVRPHAKVHKCCEIARRQLAAGAIGLTTATVYEAEAMLGAEPPEILIANEVVDPDHLERLVRVAARTSVVVAVDDAVNARRLSDTAERGGVRFGVLIDLDVGMHRCGVRSPSAAAALAGVVATLPGLALRGVMGYEGHVVLEPSPELRASMASAAMELVAEAAAALTRAGHPVEIVSAGGTNTHDMTGRHEVVTELQAGTYAVMDTGYAPLAPRFEPAISISARVVSRQGPTAILNCGTKAVAGDVSLPAPSGGIGTVRELHEEHMLLDVPADSGLQVGQRVDVAVGYTGGTVNLHDGYYVVDGDELVDVWPIVARGPGRVPSMARGTGAIR